MTATTKASRIMALHHEGKSSREIACAVFATDTPTDANMAYVRVVKNQRKGTGTSDHDRAYQRTEAYRAYHRTYRKRRYHSDSAWRQAQLDKQASRYRTNKLTVR